MSNVIHIGGAKTAPKASRSSMETVIFSIKDIGAWRVPPFQRPLRVNQKVAVLSETIKCDGGIIPGIITLGTLKGNDASIYIVDGQHRIEAFRMTGLPEMLADVRHILFESVVDMSDEYVTLNSALVKMRPDDILRGMEPSLPVLRKIRKDCAFVGYDQIRRGTSGPIVGMSMLLRSWGGSGNETPKGQGGSMTAAEFCKQLDDNSVENLVKFLSLAYAAWSRDPEYYRLWNGLNLTMCMWMWRRLVLQEAQNPSKRHATLNIKQFQSCLQALSCDSAYIDFLQGRSLTDRDRNPTYSRIKKIWSERLTKESNVRGKVKWPQPAWAS